MSAETIQFPTPQRRHKTRSLAAHEHFYQVDMVRVGAGDDIAEERRRLFADNSADERAIKTCFPKLPSEPDAEGQLTHRYVIETSKRDGHDATGVVRRISGISDTMYVLETMPVYPDYKISIPNGFGGGMMRHVFELKPGDAPIYLQLHVRCLQDREPQDGGLDTSRRVIPMDRFLEPRNVFLVIKYGQPPQLIEDIDIHAAFLLNDRFPDSEALFAHALALYKQTRRGAAHRLAHMIPDQSLRMVAVETLAGMSHLSYEAQLNELPSWLPPLLEDSAWIKVVEPLADEMHLSSVSSEWDQHGEADPIQRLHKKDIEQVPFLLKTAEMSRYYAYEKFEQFSSKVAELEVMASAIHQPTSGLDRQFVAQVKALAIFRDHFEDVLRYNTSGTFWRQSRWLVFHLKTSTRDPRDLREIFASLQLRLLPSQAASTFYATCKELSFDAALIK